MRHKCFLFCSIANDMENKGGSVNIIDEKNRGNIYWENAFVALKTISHYNQHNSDLDVGVVSNTAIPQQYQELFESNHIKTFQVPYDKYVMPDTNKWYLSFYKICSLHWCVDNLDYDEFIQIDCDVVGNGPIDDLLEEIQYSIVMLSGPFTYNHVIRKLFRQVYAELYSEQCNMMQKWGSGLICGTKSNLSAFLEECTQIYDLMRENPSAVSTEIGDEFLTSAAAYRCDLPICDGKAYMDVYWTGKFYLVSTNYKYDKMIFLHVPSEKELGMKALFSYYSRCGHFPSADKIYKTLNMPSAKYNVLSNIHYRIINKMKKKKLLS